ncbi:MAG: hypothetical protein JWR37_2693 [Mycobacterium sp.]|nr:hypothetical protein [Mycobacterium sp.]
MNLPQLDALAGTAFDIKETLDWWDSDTGCTVVVAPPSAEPKLWAEYLEGAQRSYRKHGVERALDLRAIRTGSDTALFFAAVDETGRVVGGTRAKGPLRSADESHAVVEWAGQSGLATVRKMITDRLPFGVVEMKTAWVTDDPHRNRSLTRTLARTAFPTMTLLDAQFVMATAAAHVLDRWSSSGGVVASKIPAAPYPDERYRTKMMWWDRRTFVKYAEPQQVSKTLAEITELMRSAHRDGEMGVLIGSGM